MEGDAPMNNDSTVLVFPTTEREVMQELMEGAQVDYEAPIERALRSALRGMRHEAEHAGTDDYVENWSKEILDRRPLVVLSVLSASATYVCAFEGGEDAAFTARVHHWTTADGRPLELVFTDLDYWSFLMQELRDRVDWLVREQSGVGLRGR